MLKHVIIPAAMILLTSVGCTCGLKGAEKQPVTYQRWHDMPGASKHSYLKKTVPTVDMSFDVSVRELIVSLDEMYPNCDEACHQFPMTYILENMNVMYRIEN